MTAFKWFEARQREDLARWMVVLSAFAVPLPTAWVSLATAGFLASWLCAAHFQQRFRSVWDHPIARWSLLLWAWMAVAIFWSPAPTRDAAGNLWQFRELLLLPLMASVILCDAETARRWQPRILMAFVLGFVIALITSYLRWCEVLPDMGFRGLYAGFGGRTGFSLMLAFVSFLAIEKIRGRSRHQAAWCLLLVACLANLFLINVGRTGQLGFLLLLPLLAWRWVGWRGLVGGALAIPVLCLTLYTFVPTIQDRVHQSLMQIDEFRSGKPEIGDALRLQSWELAVRFIPDSPILGGGTGSHSLRVQQAAEHNAALRQLAPGNPHNEYLLLLSQHGVVGLALLCLLWGTQWREALRQKASGDSVAATSTLALLILMASGDLANSFLLDNLEGHFYLLMTLCFAAGATSPAAKPSRTVG